MMSKIFLTGSLNLKNSPPEKVYYSFHFWLSAVEVLRAVETINVSWVAAE